MALESGTYISDLVVTNPAGTDTRRDGDNHLRLLKSTLKNTFPNVTGAVTPTHTELNYVDGVTSNIQTQLNGKEPTISASNRVPADHVATGIVNDTEFNYLNGVTSNIQTQLNAVKDYSLGAVGTYAFCAKATLGSVINSGETQNGNNLYYTGVAFPNGVETVEKGWLDAGTRPTGVWRAMGHVANTAQYDYPVTLWVRIS